MPKTIDDITKEEFQRYEGVRQSGAFNMFDPRASKMARLDEETYLAVLSNYTELMEKWPDVRKGD